MRRLGNHRTYLSYMSAENDVGSHGAGRASGLGAENGLPESTEPGQSRESHWIPIYGCSRIRALTRSLSRSERYRLLRLSPFVQNLSRILVS